MNLDKIAGAAPPFTNDVIGYSEAATHLGVAIGTVYAWVSQKRIPHFRISGRCVRFSRAALNAWLAARAVEAPSEVAP